MTPTDLDHALASLAKRRPLFHSEADFQHELAWELRERGFARVVRLELPFDLSPKRRFNVDLVVGADDGPIAVELKCWPRKWAGVIGAERFNLKNRGAQDIGRYDYWKDLRRIEELKAANLIRWGAAIALTNDFAYWNLVRTGTMAEPFCLHEGRCIAGSAAWHRKSGTTVGRDEVIALKGTYDVRWRSYSHPPGCGELRYLSLIVE